MSRKRSSATLDPVSSGSSSESSADDSEVSSSEEESQDDAVNQDFDSDIEDEGEDDSLLSWKRIPPNKPVTSSRFNFTGNPGMTIPVDSKWSPLDYLKLFLDDPIVDLIITETNRYADQYITKKYTSESRRQKYGWYPVTRDEFWAFLGLLLYQAIIIKPKARWYWTKNKMFQTPFSSSFMSLSRFEKIMKFLHFSNNDTFDASKHPSPKLNKIWELHQAINKNFQKIYIPERDLAIDESLMPSKHHLSFQQYIPLKRAQRGVKSFVLSESDSGYIVKTIIYTGKDTEKTKNYPECGVTTSIVLEIGQDFLNKGYCFVMDNFYNSPELYHILVNKQTDAYGTLRKNRKGLPEDFSKIKLKKDEAVCWKKDSIVVMKWQDKKEVSLISTCHDVSFQKVVPKHGPPKLKPTIVVDYNKTMGGVDKGDQVMGTHTLMRKQQKKYYKKIVRHLIDQCLFNAYVLYKKYKNRNAEHLAFLVQVIEQIVKVNLPNLPPTGKSAGRKRIERSLLGDTTPARLVERHFPEIIPATENKISVTRRCIVCSSKKINGKAMRKETRFHCKECDVNLCAAPCFKIYHTQEDF